MKIAVVDNEGGAYQVLGVIFENQVSQLEQLKTLVRDYMNAASDEDVAPLKVIVYSQDKVTGLYSDCEEVALEDLV